MADTVDSDRVREFEEDEKKLDAKIDQLAEWVKKSKYTVFFTGAGVSTAAGVGDYRGPSGAWTLSKIKKLRARQTVGSITEEEKQELAQLLLEQERESKKATVEVDMVDAQPTATHMAMSTLIRKGLAHYVITTNLDGVFRKSGLEGHKQLCCLHGDIYIERCTGCGVDFERNYEVRQGDQIHVHDHMVGTCSKCGSTPPKHYTGEPGKKEMQGSRWGGVLIGTRDKNMGTKDTHINFGECLDEMDWNEADEHCGKADLCIVAGTSMSLRHITHFPFKAKKVVIINLQATPDDKKCHLRIWGMCDPVFVGLMERLQIEIDPIPVWRPKDAFPIDKIPKNIDRYYVEAAKRLELMAKQRAKEAAERESKKKVDETKVKMDHLSFTTKKEEKEQDKKEAQQDTKIQTVSEAVKSGLRIGNLHQLLKVEADCPHQWTMFVRAENGADLVSFVEYVEFELHPTFDPPVLRVSEPPYQICRIGWGTFEVRIKIKWKVAFPTSTFTHRLDFSNPETSRVISVY